MYLYIEFASPCQTLDFFAKSIWMYCRFYVTIQKVPGYPDIVASGNIVFKLEDIIHCIVSHKLYFTGIHLQIIIENK